MTALVTKCARRAVRRWPGSDRRLTWMKREMRRRSRRATRIAVRIGHEAPVMRPVSGWDVD